VAPVEQIADIPLTYLAGGTDGTQPATVADFSAIWPMMDFQPVRMIAAVETSNSDVQKSLEEYCANREDNPIVFIVGQFGMDTKAQVLAAGQAFQRSNEVDAVFVHNWLGVPDPFASSPTAPKRSVPNVGHLMGQWIASISMDGIHASPARKTVPVMGATEALGYTAISDFDRTDLAEAGVNVIQSMTGRGLIVRNHFTPSTAVEFRYSNAVIMRNFVKISCVDSLQDSENTPNDIGHVINDRMACLFFMNRLWNQGSSGNVPTGETFGQYQKSDGSMSGIDEAFEIIADASNNSIASLMAGERNVDIWFAFPAPGGSIKVGVGLIYRVNG
jgi:phage tail sheath protein FI